ncbi:MAG: domain S-box [Candidatus Saccharibacteria bacterium]|nr:domain S-box [Candidatus Saccharibacteria bacterium]
MSAPAHPNPSKSNRFTSVVLFLTLLMGIGTIAYFVRQSINQQSVDVLKFTWRPGAIFIIASASLLLGILVPLNRPKYRSHITLWLSLYVVSGFSASLTFLLGAISSSPQMATYWSAYGSGSSIFIGLTFLLFVLAYVNQEEWLFNPVYLILWTMPAIYVFRNLHISVDPSKPFNYMAASNFEQAAKGNHVWVLFFVWIYFSILVSLALLLRHFATLKHGTAKYKQVRLLLTGMGMPVIFSVAGFLPVLKHYSAITNCISLSMEVILLGYAILKYGLFSVNPATLSDTILGTMNEAVVTVNPQLDIQRINTATAGILGVSQPELEEQNLRQVFGDEMTDTIVKKLQTAGMTDALELTITSGDALVPISLLTSTIFNTDQSVAGYILVFRDISKEHAVKAEIERQVIERTEQVHEEQTKLKASIESLNLGLAMIDKDNKVVLSNQAVGKLLGTSTSDWTLPALAGQLGDDFDLETACLTVRQTNQSQYIEKVTAGSSIFRIFLAPVDYRKDAAGIVILIEDITEKEMMNRSRDEFFSIASHELRTPLTTIRGNTGMIMDFYAEALKDEELKGMINDVHESSIRLIGIVNDFLDVSRLEQNKVSFVYEEIPLGDIVQTVAGELAPVLEAKHLTLQSDSAALNALPKLWADKNRLKQIIFNLIDNGAKFTEEGSVSVRAEAANNTIKIFITDTGRGISKDNQKLLFRKFQQASDSLLTRDTTKGTGLGLYVSKMMVGLMGGSLQLESSEEGKGTTFCLTILAASAENKLKVNDTLRLTDATTGLSVENNLQTADAPTTTLPLEQAEATPNPDAAIKLLIVEDDPYVIRLYQRLFSHSKLDVKVASDGAQCLELVKSYNPDLVLLDVMMPVLNGLETLDALKANATTKDIPVIMLSNFDDQQAVTSALAKGASDYLIKSDFTAEQVLELIHKTLGKPFAGTPTA